MTAVPNLTLAAGKDGPPVVMIHGFGADRLIWTANVHALAAAARVYVLDLPGHGATPLEGEGRLADLAAAVARAIEAAGIAPVHLIAHSLGGAVAIVLAASRPELVRSLALIAAAGLGRPVDERFLKRFPEIRTPEETMALLQRLVSRPRLINRMLAAGTLEKLNQPGARESYRAVAADLTDVNAAIEPYLGALARSSIPRLAIWGAADPIIPPDPDRLELFGAESLMLRDAAHLPHVENAREVNDKLTQWIAAQGA